MLPPKIRLKRVTKFLSLCPRCKKEGYREERALDRSIFGDIPVGKSKCRSCAMLGRQNRGDGKSNREGYEIEAVDGSVLVRQADGSFKSKHRIVMEGILGRALSSGELVRFRDLNKKNLDPSNLYIELRKGVFGDRKVGEK